MFQLQVTVCSLLTEIVMATEPHTWLPHLQEHSVMAALLVSLESYIKVSLLGHCLDLSRLCTCVCEGVGVCVCNCVCVWERLGFVL